MAQISDRFPAFQQMTRNLKVSTTSTSTVLSAYADGDNYLMDLAGVLMVSTTTELTATLAWTDPSTSAAQTYSWLTASSKNKGPVPLALYAALVAAGTTATVKVTTTVSGAVRASIYARAASGS